MIFNWRIVAAIAVAFFLAGSHWKAYKIGSNHVQSKWDAYTVQVQSETIYLQQQAKDKESQLQADKESLRKAKNAQIAKLDTDLADALSRLRDRPERPSEGDLSANSGDGQVAGGCTGAQLFRSDSELLTRLGRDADELRINLKACYEQYESARQALTK